MPTTKAKETFISESTLDIAAHLGLDDIKSEQYPWFVDGNQPGKAGILRCSPSDTGIR
jgi:hypothetical protein